MANEYAIPSSLDAVLATSLSDYRKGTSTDQIYNSNVVLKLLNQRKRLIDGGASITYSLINRDQSDGGFYLGADMLNTLQPKGETLCEFKWQNAYEPVQLTRDEERSNSGEEHKIVDLVGLKIGRSELAISKRLEQALSAPVAGANNLIDLETLVATGTLGTIPGATETYWQSTVTASGSFAAQGRTDLTTATYAVASSSDVDTPNLYLTTKTNFQRFEQQLLPNERIQNASTTYNTGAKNLSFKGEPVVYGNFIGSGLFFGLNTNYLELPVDTETDMVLTPWVTPTNQTAKVAFFLWRGNLTTDNRRRHFKLTGVTA